MTIEYLLFNIIVILGPLILSSFSLFFVKKPLLKKAVVPIIIPAIIFIVWDIFVVNYFWFFNPKYVLGIYFWGLPIEEYLFFITVPYACLFVWENWQKIIENKKTQHIHPILIVTLGILAILYRSLPYTFVVLLVFICIIILDWVLKTHLFNSLRFISFLGIVIILTLISNGFLTARPIVLYNETVKTNLLVGTVPIEDIVYGLALISFVIILYSKKR